MLPPAPAALVPPTSVTVTEVVPISIEDLDKHIRSTMSTCGQLVAQRDRITGELRSQAKDILYPALIEMRKHFYNPGARTDLLPGIPTFGAYLGSIGFCESLLRVWDHRAKKDLEGLLGQKRIGSGSSSAPGSSSLVVTNDDPDNAVKGDATSALINLGYKRADAKQAITHALNADQSLASNLNGLIRFALSKGRVAPASAPAEETISPKTPPNISNATNVANEKEIEQMDREIDAKATDNHGPAENPLPEIIPGLTRRESPAPPVEQDKHGHAALYHGAQAAAVATAAKNLAGANKEQAVVAADSSVLTNENNSTSDSSVVIDPTELECAGVRPAEEGFLFAAPPVAEPEKVAAALDKLDPSVSELNEECDWKQVLVELLQVLEQSGDRLPLVVLAEKRKIESLLAGKGPGRPVGARSSTTTKRYTKVMKLNQEGNRH